MFLLRIPLFVLIACSLAALAAAVSADTKIHQLLDKMNQTLEKGNYEGTFVFMHSGMVETMHIMHGYSDGNVREKLTSLTGDAREVIRDQDVLTCIWPREKLVLTEHASDRHGIPSSFPGDLDELARHYKLTEVGQARIAGHDCTIVKIEPLDEYRYGHRLCIESQGGMVLEFKTFGTNGETIENMMFTSFRMRDSAPETLFEPGAQLKDYTWKTAKVERNGELQPDRAWKIKKLPPGFALRNVTRRVISASNKPVQHMVLTDGLASVSVFISKIDNPKQVYKGAHKKGAINAYARDTNQHQITVVGEVPEDTVRMIGSSIFYSNP